MRLPVSHLDVTLRQPDGTDELVLLETPGSPVARSLALLARLSADADFAVLTITDFETVLLDLRSRIFGETMSLGFGCPDCGARVEVSFVVSDFMASVRARRPATVADAPGRPGWFVCQGIVFRLPTAGDQAAVLGHDDAARLLVARCIEQAPVSARQRAIVERAMAAMAPEVSRALAGVCPACAAEVEAYLHVTRLVANELAREAASLHDEVHLIARSYHWHEADILRLPRRRRRAYLDSIRQAA